MKSEPHGLEKSEADSRLVASQRINNLQFFHLPGYHTQEPNCPNMQTEC